MTAQASLNGNANSGQSSLTDDIDDNGLYAVGHILTRSLDQGVTPDNKYEYQYLVRWDGFGPREDTWEFRSNLLEGAASLVRAFDNKERAFTILNARERKGEIQYLVRYGIATSNIPPSPYYQKIWLTEEEMRMYNRPMVVRAAIRQLQRLQKSQARYVTRAAPKPKPKKVSRILEILDDQRQRTKSGKTSPVYLVRYVQEVGDDEETVEAWMSTSSMLSKFTALYKEPLAAYRESIRQASSQKAESPEDTGPNEYELERQRNIEQNQQLLRELGLGSIS